MDLTGGLVRLRALRPGDAPLIAALLADPDVVRHLANWSWVPYSEEDASDFIRRHDPATMRWGIECLADGAFLGCTGLHDLNFRNRNCHWGIWIGPPTRWGQGFGTETCRLVTSYAFTHLGMEKVYLEVYEGNERAQRCYERAGYRVEGVLGRHVWNQGRLATARLMAAYRDDPLYTPEPPRLG